MTAMAARSLRVGFYYFWVLIIYFTPKEALHHYSISNHYPFKFSPPPLSFPSCMTIIIIIPSDMWKIMVLFFHFLTGAIF